MRGREGWAVAAVLAAAAFLACGGTRFGELGFYHDDWILLSTMSFGPEPGFLGRVRALLEHAPSFLLRPLDAPLLAALFGLFGTDPLGWQAVLLASNAACALLAARLLSRLGADAAGAALGGTLLLCYPNKDSTAFWPMLVVSPLALALFLSATLVEARRIEAGGRAAALAAPALLIAAFGLYELCLPLVFLWPLLPARDEASRARARRGLLSAGACVAAYVLFKLVVVPYGFGVAFNKPLSASPLNALVVALRAVESNVGWRLALAVAGGVRRAFAESPVAAAAALALPWAALRFLPRREGGGSLRVAAFGAGTFALGYLPLLVSDYRPTPLTVTNRVNLVAAVGAAALWSAAASAGWRRTAAAAASAALCAHVGFAGAWREGYRRQLAVRDAVLRVLPDWPAETVLLVRVPVLEVDRRAPVFLASWDTAGAVRLWTGEKERDADVVRPGFALVDGGVRTSGRLLPRARVRLLDVEKGTLRVIP